MNKDVEEKFKELIKPLNNFLKEVNNDKTEYCWTYDYAPDKPDHFTLYEMNTKTRETIDELEIPCYSGD